MSKKPTHQSPVQMVTPTDVHALRRVVRLFSRMSQEAEQHEGHGPTCPFQGNPLDDLSFPEFLTLVEAGCESLVEAYEAEYGDVPPLPVPSSVMQA